ncbi:MAG: cobalamin biosynthesis protein CobD/CbiB, partial [Desulfomonilaceae bacterium]
MNSIPLQVLLAMILDAMIGDPRQWPHPVRLIARWAVFLEPKTRTSFQNQRIAGLVVALVVASVCIATHALLGLAGYAHPLARDVISILIIYTGIARHDLAKHARDIYQALTTMDITASRRLVGMICGRDTEGLDAQGVVR